jgi:hypothetical protein
MTIDCTVWGQYTSQIGWDDDPLTLSLDSRGLISVLRPFHEFVDRLRLHSEVQGDHPH